LTPRNHYMKGLLLAYEPQTRLQGESYFLRALEVAPDFYPAYARLSDLRLSQGALAAAVDLAERSLRIEPRADWVREQLSRQFTELGDDAASIEVAARLGQRRASPFHESYRCYRSGDVERAAALAARGVALWSDRTLDLEFGYHSGPLALLSIAERAASTKNHAGAIEQLERSVSLLGRATNLGRFAEVNLSTLNSIAWLDIARGRSESGRSLALEVLSAAEAALATARGPSLFARERARSLALLGRRDEAMQALEDLNTMNWRFGAWTLYQRDPVFVPLRSEPRFQAAARRYEAGFRAELEKIEALRASGKIPRRATGPVPGPCDAVYQAQNR
jgi:tetratricopeptide (TPR) repeat protein